MKKRMMIVKVLSTISGYPWPKQRGLSLHCSELSFARKPLDKLTAVMQTLRRRCWSNRGRVFRTDRSFEPARAQPRNPDPESSSLKLTAFTVRVQRSAVKPCQLQGTKDRHQYRQEWLEMMLGT